MKSLFFSALVLAVVAAAVAVDIDLVGTTPPIPALYKQFQSNYTIEATNYKSSQLFHGMFDIDDVNGGGVWTLGGEDFIPLYLATNFKVHPEEQELTGFVYEGDICWKHSVDKSFLHLFPLEIPKRAKFQGSATVNGTMCDGWAWNDNDEAGKVDIQFWVTQTTPAQLVQIVGTPNSIVGPVRWTFYERISGAFSPSIYAPPALDCQVPLETDTSSPFSMASFVKNLVSIGV